MNKNINNAMSKIFKSQNLCKLLYYATNPLSQPDIDNTRSILLMNNVYPLPKPPPAQEDRKVYLSIILSEAKMHNKGQSFKDYKLIINIVCHIDLWMIAEGLRPLLISHELDKIFNKTRSADLTIGESLFDNWIYREYSDYFCGYYQSYILTNFN